MTLVQNGSGDGNGGRNAWLLAAVLSGIAIVIFCLIVIFVDNVVLRSASFFLGGLIAGAAAVLAWLHRRADVKNSGGPQSTPQVDRSHSWTDLVAALPEPAIIVDNALAVLHYNTAADALFERLKTGLALEHVHRDPELISAVKTALERAEQRTARLVASKGLGRHLKATVTPIRDGRRQRTLAVLISVEDQSEQHRLLEMRSDFIANASHELRTPLASVRGFIETLQGPARNDEQARERFLSIMADQAERMTRLIEDLLLLSRVEEKVNLQPTGNVHLMEVIDDVVTSLSKAAEERRIKIIVEPPVTRLVAIGDRDELFQVFQNLIENAIKYGHEGGKVHVSLTQALSARPAGGGRAVVKITDDGPGIAPEHLPRLTERFYRVSAEQSRQIGGTGLGLAIVKHVLNRHAAELHIASVVGTGTTFRVVLPLSKITK